jgi:hypothetical protein
MRVYITYNVIRRNDILLKVKRLSSPVTGLDWPRGFQEVKVPRFHDNGTGWWYSCQPHAPAAFTPRKLAWYSFLLEA